MIVPRTSARPWLIGFGAAAGGLGVFLLLADHPGEIAAEVAARVADGKKPRAESDFALGLWWAAAANLVLCLALLAGMRLWARHLPPPDAGKGIVTGRSSRLFLLGLLAILALAGAMRWPLAHRSLWWDELWAIKYGVVGYYIGDAETPLEERRFGEGSWQRSLWHYTRPMNHPAASFPARLTHVVWRAFVRPDQPHEFSDFAVRFPNWLASLAAVAAVGVAGSLWGRPLAGLIAALLLAVHPWHIRYGVDLRGYSWLILWSAAGLLWLTVPLRAGKSRWWPWWAFGANQMLLVWSFPHGAKVAAAFAIAAACLIPRMWAARGDRLTAWLRLALVNLAAAMVWLQLFAPNLLQMTRWWTENAANHTDHPIDAALLGETFTLLLSGSLWPATAWEWLAITVLAFTFLIGLCQKRRNPGFWPLISLIAAGILMLAWFAVADTYYYARFMTFLLVPFCLATGLAVDWSKPASRYRVLAAAAVVLAFITLATPQWRLLFSQPYAPMRDVARMLNSHDRDSIIACYGHGSEMLPQYAPRLRAATSFDDLKELVGEAAATGKGLLVAYGYPSLNRAGIPEGFQWLDDPARFQPAGQWSGIEPQFEFRVLRWTGQQSD